MYRQVKVCDNNNKQIGNHMNQAVTMHARISYILLYLIFTTIFEVNNYCYFSHLADKERGIEKLSNFPTTIQIMI